MTSRETSAGTASTGPAPVDLLGWTRARLRTELAPWVDHPYRADQIFRALHHRGVASFSDITDLPKALRRTLEERFCIGLPRIESRRASEDGAVKYLFRLQDGAGIEAVDIPEIGRHTLCISSQAGCALACRFCVTGYWGAGRNLSPGEILGQVLAIRRERGDDLPPRMNLVLMGMGEPLLNLEALRDALVILTENLSWRRVTVSTAGVVPGIDDLARWPERPNLAISLHAPDDERRSRLMPINRSYPLAELLAAVKRFPLERGRRVTFEYLLIAGFNDAPDDADAVARRIRGIPAKLNLIPLNPDPVLGEEMKPPAPTVVEAFRLRLRSRGVTATVRRRRGEEVSAACGQLRAFDREPRGPVARRGARPSP